MKLNFNYRKWFYLDKEYNKQFNIEISGWDSHPAIYFKANPSSRKHTLHIGFGIGIWISLERVFSKKWFPKGYDPKSISFTFHHYGFWWDLWMNDHSWKATDPKWRRNNIDFQKLLIGKHNCEWETIEQKDLLVNMIEGSYKVRVLKKLRMDKWQRWFTRKSIAWEVNAGYEQDGKFIEVGIPIEGKGENSWDCDENARYGANFPDKNDNHASLGTCEKAALYFETSIKKDRIRYGGNNWVPKAHRAQEMKIITA